MDLKERLQDLVGKLARLAPLTERTTTLEKRVAELERQQTQRQKLFKS